MARGWMQLLYYGMNYKWIERQQEVVYVCFVIRYFIVTNQ